jgi:uncharacterized membrane protein SirB2
MSITLVKFIHVGAAILSGLGFFVRGIWVLQDTPLRHHVWVRVLPHVNDTLLLISAVTLATMLQLSPFTHSWLAVKISALLVYITLGLVAFRFARRKWVQLTAWLAAMWVFAYIVWLAVYQPVWFGSMG